MMNASPVQRGLGPQIDDRDSLSARDTRALDALRELPAGGSEGAARYQVVCEIARGGMGVVLRVYDPELDRTLAVKVLLERHHNRADLVARFLDEARIHARLQHPGVAPLHELGHFPDGRPYFAMKLVEGRTLSALLKERTALAQELPRWLAVFAQVCQTLAFAHSRRIVHRDLKPLNIMVGEFGEVQVMDWGLAHPLDAAAGSADGELWVDSELGPAPAADSADAHTVVAAATTDDERLTRVGMALGTPAYMPPEQARGELDRLDERCDVFGLGAILCEILTGLPPFRGPDSTVVLTLARRGDLADAFARLDSCGAEGKLVELARTCLAADAAARPRDAAAVAGAMTDYLASVQERLKGAEIERAAAHARAAAERYRRRLAVGLAAAVVLLIGGAGAAGLWYFRDQAQREAQTDARRTYLETEVSGALDEAQRQRSELLARLHDERRAAQLLSDLAEWRTLSDSVRAAWTRADRLAAAGRDLLSEESRGRLELLAGQLAADDADRQTAFELDRLRLATSTPIDGQLRLSGAEPELERLFRAAGYDLDQGDLEEMAARIRNSPIRLPLVAGLDFWALATNNEDLRARLFDVARRSDPDVWRDRLRQSAAWGDLANLKTLAHEVDFTEQSPQLLTTLAQRLRLTGGDAASLVRQALVRHPRDFWLLYELGLGGKSTDEQSGAFRAALAIRPDSGISYYNLGVLHYGERRLEDALACYQRSVELDSASPGSFNNVGLVLDDLGRNEEAQTAYRRAIAIDPRYVMAWTNLGASLQAQRKLDEAVDCYRKAIDFDPRNAPALNNLGAALREQGIFDEAVDCLRRVVALQPTHSMAWCNLGHTLNQQGKFEEALEAMRRGHELGSKERGWTWPSAQWVRDTEQWLAVERKLPGLLSGELKPVDGREALLAGKLCDSQKKRFGAAARFYAAAFAADRKLAEDLQAGNRYKAACTAALASAGEGSDADELDADRRRELRQQALDWLRAELDAWSSSIRWNPLSFRSAAETLSHWLTSPDLSAVRDEVSLAELSPDEQLAWKQLWSDVEALRKRVTR